MRSSRAHRTRRRFDSVRPLASKPIRPKPQPPRRDTVLFTRPEAATPVLRQALRARGYRVLVQPMLEIHPLQEPLPDTSDAQAVIVTSSHALRGLQADMFPQPIPVFAVGQATAAAARRCGFGDVHAANDARTLAADVRAACSPRHGPLLYLAGRHRARDLARMLPDFEVRLAERYSAEPARNLLPPVRQAIARGEIAAVTLYSGRAARAYAAACRRDGVLPQARRIPTLCLSRRIAALLQAQGWRAAWGAPLPQASCLTTRLLGRRFSRAAPKSPDSAPPAATYDPQPIREEAMTNSSPATTDAETDQPPRSNAVAPHWIAIAALAVVAAVAVIWLWSELRNAAADRDAIATSVAGLSTRLDEFASNPAFTDPDMVDKLATKVTELDERISENSQSVAAIGERLGVRASAVDAQLDSQKEELAVLKQQTADLSERQRADAASATQGLEMLNATVGDLSKRLDRLETRVEGMQPALMAERLIALAELRRTVDTGKPFADPLQRVRAVLPASAEPATDAGWASHADKGVATAAELSQRLTVIARGRPQASPIDSGSEWVDSAVGTLLKGVRIGDGPALGADPVSDAIRFAQQALAEEDLDAADAAVAPIAEQVPAVMEWRQALRARREALAAIAAWEKTVLADNSEASQ